MARGKTADEVNILYQMTVEVKEGTDEMQTRLARLDDEAAG